MQAIESAALSLATFRERAGFALAPEAGFRKRRRDITDALKTVYWVYGVSAAFDGADYKTLERLFAPHSAACNDADPVFTNLWLGYFLGRHKPTRVLAAVESAAPGANACLSSPLWPALTNRPLTRPQLFELLKQLKPEVRDVVLPSAQAGKAGEKQALMLELRASLDALAAEVLLLRLAHLEGRHWAAFVWGRRLWRLMVLLGMDFEHGGIAQALADLLEERVMPMATLEGIRFGFPPGGYVRLIPKFELSLYCLARASKGPKTERKLLRIAQDMMDLKWGYGYRFAFNPVQMRTGDQYQLADLSPTDARESRVMFEHLNLHRWGLNMQDLGGHRNRPPDTARSGEDLWAIDPDDPYVVFEPESFRTGQTE